MDDVQAQGRKAPSAALDAGAGDVVLNKDLPFHASQQDQVQRSWQVLRCRLRCSLWSGCRIWVTARLQKPTIVRTSVKFCVFAKPSRKEHGPRLPKALHAGAGDVALDDDALAEVQLQLATAVWRLRARRRPDDHDVVVWGTTAEICMSQAIYCHSWTELATNRAYLRGGTLNL